MKPKVLLGLLLIILLASCNEVRFMQPQPAGKRELTKFPKKFIGKYVAQEGKDKDTLVVYSQAFLLSNELYSLSSEDVVLKKYSKYYIISLKTDKKSSSPWDVYLASFKNEILTISSLHFEGKSELDHVVNQIESIVEVQKVFKTSGQLDYILIDPTKKQLKTLIEKDVFSELCKYQKVN